MQCQIVEYRFLSMRQNIWIWPPPYSCETANGICPCFFNRKKNKKKEKKKYCKTYFCVYSTYTKEQNKILTKEKKSSLTAMKWIDESKMQSTWMLKLTQSWITSRDSVLTEQPDLLWQKDWINSNFTSIAT